MRRAGALCIAMLLAGCDPKGSSLSAEPGPLARVGADATVGGATEDTSAPDTYVAPSGSWSVGPDGAAPATCDAASACVAPPPSCSGPSTGVIYGAQQCTSGVCSWMTTAFDCAAHGIPGAVCLGGWNGGDASLPPDAGMGARNGPCWDPAPEGPTPPVVACDMDAGDGGGLCPPPPSQCVNGVDGGAAAQWLAYNDNGECVSGQCVWETKFHFCGYRSIATCVSGACIGTITPPVPIPPGP